MVLQSAASLDRVFHALANQSRRAMLRQLASGERNIGGLAEPLNMTFAGASKHVRVLEEAGLVSRRVEGRTHLCRLEPQALASAEEWLRFYEGFWTQQFDALEAALQAQAEGGAKHTRLHRKG
jgi:DNA-binding transcriptional ArsR family regulator